MNNMVFWSPYLGAIGVEIVFHEDSASAATKIAVDARERDFFKKRESWDKSPLGE